MLFIRTIFVVTLIAIILSAVSCNKTAETTNTKTISADEQVKIDQRLNEFEQYKQKLDIICAKKTTEITGLEFAKCKDYNDYDFIYEEFLWDFKDSDFTYLPEFCKRAIKELSGKEMIDCLAKEPESEETGNTVNNQ